MLPCRDLGGMKAWGWGGGEEWEGGWRCGGKKGEGILEQRGRKEGPKNGGKVRRR